MLLFRRTGKAACPHSAHDTLEAPDRRVAGHGNRHVLLRGYDDPGRGQPMVLCVVVEDRAEETVVVTVYRSSRIQKYMGGEAT